MKTKRRIISPPLEELEKLRTPLEPGEKHVLDFFQHHLPVEWEIYIQPHLNGLRPDFVLLNPHIGIAVFEVKNWNLTAMRYWVDEERSPPTLMGNDGTRDFSLKASDPVSRIRLYKEMIKDLFCPRMNKTAANALITAGIIFTSSPTERVEQLLSPLLERYKMRTEKARRYYPVSGLDALENGAVSVVFPESERRSSGKMHFGYAQDLRNWLVEPSISSEQRKPLPIDSRQRELATTRAPQGYRRIRGPAGSGKSLVLAARAGQLVSEGRDILVVSFNITLLHYLQDLTVRWSEQSRGARKKATWWNFHFWCRYVCFEAGASDDYWSLWKSFFERKEKLSSKEDGQELDEFLAETLPDLVSRVLDNSPDQVTKYDAILVDEGQDFIPKWWNLLRRVCKHDGEMLLVADSTQDIYGTAARWTDEAMTGAGFRGAWSILTISYRLPNSFLPLVREYAARYLPSELANLPDPTNELPDIFPCTQRWVQIVEGSPAQVCSEEVLRLLKRHSDGKLSAADVIFLSPRIGDGADVIQILKEKYKYSFAHTFSPYNEENRKLKHAFFLGDAKLKATTIHSFKGYEGRALVLLIDDNLAQPMRELLYVGMTRLREDSEGSYITVVCADATLAEFGRKWPEYEEMRGEQSASLVHETRGGSRAGEP